VANRKEDDRGLVTKDTILEYWELREHGVPFSRSHLARLEEKGKFPKRVPIGELRIGWIAGEIWDWRDARISSRSTVTGGSRGTKKRGADEGPALNKHKFSLLHDAMHRQIMRP